MIGLFDWFVSFAVLLHSCAFGIDTCSERCSFCELGSCSECVYGWYGQNCNSKCQHCWISGCHRLSGICEQCKPGRYKEDCRTPCPDNCGCDKNGEIYCERVNGKCLDGCKKGWWGETCSRPCSENCVSGICLQANGQCVGKCKTGWWGSACTDQCSASCYNNICMRMTGSCKFGSKNAFTSKNFSEGFQKCRNKRHVIKRNSVLCIDGCDNGFASRSCNEKCHGTCLKCHQFTKMCDECPVSFYGNDCMNECLNCKTRACDMNGKCIRGCRDGFRGSTCNKTCPFNCVTCEQEAHKCTQCKPGWIGKLCQQESQLTLLEDGKLAAMAENSGCRLHFEIIWLLMMMFVYRD